MTAPSTAGDQPAIRTDALTRRFRSTMRTVTAVDHLDLVVPTGSAFGLLGPNGAGKTTTIQMVLGLVRPSSGSSSIFGGRIDQHEVRRVVGFVPEKFQLPRAWTAREYVELHAALHGLRGAERRSATMRVLQRTGIAERADDRLGGFSKGMQQRAAIAQALVGAPRLLVLDEPTSALDPIGRLQVRELLRELHADGVTIVFNSHILGEVEAICDQVAIMRDGQVLHQGPVDAPADEHGVVVSLRVSGADEESLRAALAVGSTITELQQLHRRGEALEAIVALDDAAHAALLVRTLVEAGIDVLELTPRREGLESLFVRLVGAAPDEGAGAA